MRVWDKYIDDVLNGEINACELVKKACRRFLAFKKKYEFDEKAVDRVVIFFSYLQHTKGKYYKKPFELEPWQQFVVASIFGFKKDGKRVVKSVYLELARKNGKTAFAAGLSLYFLVYSGIVGAEVYLAANSRQQSGIAFDMCRDFTRLFDPKGRSLKVRRTDIEFDKIAGKLVVLAADDSKLDGFNALLYILDEYHAAPNSRLRDVLKSSQAMWDEPMEVIITTAGFNKSGPCYKHRQVCTEILNGVKEDDSNFCIIYTLDEGDDWTDENNWIKANPNLGVTVKKDNLSDYVTEGLNNTASEVGIKTKNFNVWMDTMEVWIPDNYIYDVTEEVDMSTWGDYPVYIGIDLAATSDLTNVTWMCDKGDVKEFKAFYYLPSVALIEKPQKDLYREWSRNKHLIICDGNVTDYDYILEDIWRVKNKYDLSINKIAYDRYNSTQFVISAEQTGLPMEPFSQSLGSFNQPTKELERLIRSKGVIIDNNPINRYCFRNATIISDRNGNIKPVKALEANKIDGVIGIIQSLGVYLGTPQYDVGL